MKPTNFQKAVKQALKKMPKGDYKVIITEVGDVEVLFPKDENEICFIPNDVLEFVYQYLPGAILPLRNLSHIQRVSKGMRINIFQS